ncbi:MAG TPA: EF-P lysine aminoacylase EpmA [Geobacteraceae bacterium]
MPVNRSLAGRREALLARADIIQRTRQFFIEGGYLEIETPFRIPAPAPESHIDAIPADGWFLHTSPEICMKRMLAAGYERLFQVCRCWRHGERGTLHLPEFTMLEWYRSGADYQGLMEECEELVRALVSGMGLGETVSCRGRRIEVSGTWERISVSDAYRRFAGIPVEQAMEQDRFDEVMVQDIEPMLGLDRPTFLYDYPAERGALARLKEGNAAVAERFELYIGGVEIANAFSELTDANEQRTRFVREAAYRESTGKTPYPSPEKFLAELPHMPQAAGIALGVDRLVMVLLGKETIDEVVAFTPEEL